MTGTSDLDRFANGGIAGRQDRLPGPLRDLHRAVLRRFLATGAAPTARWLRQAAADLGLGPDAAGQLAAADAVHLGNGLVTVAYPFSGTPTPHRVELDDTPAVYAMCAIDALGLPAMTGRHGRITSADPLDAQPIEVTVRGGAWTWTPGSAVVIIARAADCGTDCGSWESMCPNTTFRASRDSAQAFLSAHDCASWRSTGSSRRPAAGRAGSHHHRSLNPGARCQPRIIGQRHQLRS